MSTRRSKPSSKSPFDAASASAEPPDIGILKPMSFPTPHLGYAINWDGDVLKIEVE